MGAVQTHFSTPVYIKLKKNKNKNKNKNQKTFCFPIPNFTKMFAPLHPNEIHHIFFYLFLT
jgi:hypothetical protein